MIQRMFLTGLAATLMFSTAMGQSPQRRGPGGEGRPNRPPREGEAGPGEGRRGFRPPPNPLIEAIDADADGVLSPEEIENAAAALRKLDKNNDGRLTEDEMRPQFGRGPGGPEGPGGPGGPEGPGEGRRRGPAAPEQFVAQMLKLDSDGDGKISESELPERMRRIFANADANKDGGLDEAELREAAKRFNQGGPGRGQRGGQGGERPRRPEAD